jgi:hypothetical protein
LENWKIFDELIGLLNSDNKTDFALEFMDAQKYVNGLTDGWYEFKSAFENSLNANKQNLREEQNQIVKGEVDIKMTNTNRYE